MALRRGRQYLREISGDGVNFGYPRLLGGELRSLVPWSRIFNDEEMLLAINTDPVNPRQAWVIVDKDLHPAGTVLACLYSTEAAQEGQETLVQEMASGARAVLLQVPPAGFVIYE
jgi:hypothetical protein